MPHIPLVLGVSGVPVGGGTTLLEEDGITIVEEEGMAIEEEDGGGATEVEGGGAGVLEVEGTVGGEEDGEPEPHLP